MNIYILGVVAVGSAVIAVIIKNKNKDLGLSLSIAAIAVIFMAGLELALQIIENINALSAFDEMYFDIALKILGLNIFSKICISICEDSGEKGLATAVDICSKFACVAIAFPLFERLLEMINNILALA